MDKKTLETWAASLQMNAHTELILEKWGDALRENANNMVGEGYLCNMQDEECKEYVWDCMDPIKDETAARIVGYVFDNEIDWSAVACFANRPYTK